MRRTSIAAGAPRRRCAIYTRKSVEEGLDMQFNSLDAQREAGENYIASQRANGWVCLPDRYDDGGFTGGNTNRPALQRLLADCEAGKVDVVVVYKIDRLSRSICDFADLSKKFDLWSVSFCSVTQDINTATSSGRMMLNILVTFAQYEREVIGERIRDKFAASRRKGIWMGGVVPYGYRVQDRRLHPVPDEAETVRRIFARYLETQSPKTIAAELNAAGLKTKAGREWDKGKLHHILHNPIYIGKIAFKGEEHAGEHEAIVNEDVWREVQELIRANAERRSPDLTRKPEKAAPLKDIVRCGHCGGPMTPYTKKKGGVAYTYYRCSRDQRRPVSICPIRQISAQTVEDGVFAQVSGVLRSPEVLPVLSDMAGLTAGEVARAIGGGMWETATAAERKRLFELLIEAVTLHEDRMEIEIRAAGLNAAMEVLNAGKM